MPPPRLFPGKGSDKPELGRSVGRTFDPGTRETPSSTRSPTSISLGSVRRKRNNDGVVDEDTPNKRPTLSNTTRASSSLVSDRVDRAGSGQRATVIDLTGDDPQSSSSGRERSVKGTASLTLGSPPSAARSASHGSRLLSATMPTRGVKQKSEFIDLTLDDLSEDDSTVLSNPRLGKTAKSESIENVIDLTEASIPQKLATAFKPLQLTDGTSAVSKDKQVAPTKAAPAQKPRSADSGQTSNPYEPQPNSTKALDEAAVIELWHRIKEKAASDRARIEPSELRNSFAPMPDSPHNQQQTDIDNSPQKSVDFMNRAGKAAGPRTNRLPALDTESSVQPTQARRGAAITYPAFMSPDSNSDAVPSEPKNNTSSTLNIAHGLPQLQRAVVHLANGLPSLDHIQRVERDQQRRGSTIVPRVKVQDCDYGPRKTDGEPIHGDRQRAGDGRVVPGGANVRFSTIDSDTAKDVLSRLDQFKKQQMLLTSLKTNELSRKKGPPVVSFQTRVSDVSDSVQDRGSSSQQAVVTETDSVGEGNGSTELSHDEPGVSRSVPVGACQLQEPSGLMVQDQAQKQSEIVADGLVEVSDESDKHSPTSSTPEISPTVGPSDAPQSLQQQQQQRMPRRSRRKREKIVVMRAPSRELHRISLRPVQRPDLPMSRCFLIQMPMEIQQKIFRYLLLAEDPIQVFQGWSKLYHRQRSNLDPAILSTCRALFENGSAVLYGANTFQYKLRDPARSGTFQDVGQTITVEKYIPYFRKLELKIERSRTELTYCTALAAAIRALTEHGADLRELVLDTSPSVEGNTLSTVGYFYRQGEVIEALKALRTCFIEVRVFTPKTSSAAAKSLRCIIDKRTEASTSRPDSQQAATQPAGKELDKLSEMISYACENPSKAVARGWFDEFEASAERWNEHLRCQGKIADSGEDGDQSSADDEDLSNDDNDDTSDFEG
ncbi:hypothetical protein J7T55_003601 [Diaporthe amygdali]|uniref:uncharacterized protein n=1 Tax=Phomopsis amygdali TaxID=1214568 RepID=UPI0022FE6B37|nr:uncharacterized protein J7T55_003601 [Diaporthe amygdali]KAJ0117184.1 hypothetical protein J7T55_003601 [Diaporthe amygdali]